MLTDNSKKESNIDVSAMEPAISIVKLKGKRFSRLLESYGFGGLFHTYNKDSLLPSDKVIFYDHLGNYRRLMKLQDSNADFYYFDDMLDPDSAKLIRSKGGKLLLDLSSETIPFPIKKNTFQSDIEKIYSTLKEEGISPSNLMILNANMKADVVHNSICDSLSISERINIQCIDYFLYFTHARFMEQFSSVKARETRVTQAKKTVSSGLRREKKFVCLNRKPKGFRTAIVAFLLSRGLLDQSFVSYMGPNVDKKYSGSKQFSQQMVNSVASILDDKDLGVSAAELSELMPLVLDKKIESSVPSLAYDFSDQLIYSNSYINIATETLFSDGETLFPTEKCLKPILYLQPFIVVGDPGQLQFLRDNGFKTFHPLIDENYDTVSDPTIRMQLILHEIERLGNLSLEQIHELYCELWDVIIHNFNHMTDAVPSMFYNTLNKDFAPNLRNWIETQPIVTTQANKG